VTWETDAVWITTKQVAARFGISQRRVRQLAKDRGITGRKIGPLWVFTESEVRDMKPRPPGAGSHTRNIIVKQLGEEVEQIVRNARSEDASDNAPPLRHEAQAKPSLSSSPSPSPSSSPSED